MKLFERKECPFCKEKNFELIYKISYSDKKIKKFLSNYYNNPKLENILEGYEYSLCKCLKCSGIFQKSIPDNQFSEYIYNKLISQEDSFKKKQINKSKNDLQYLNDSKIIKKLFNKDNREIKILEFGCGWGFWSIFMKSRNFNVQTCEISDSRIEFLNKNKIKNFEKLDLINEKFDFIFSDQVIEHIPEPYESLKDLSNLLKVGGYMLHRFPSSLLLKLKLKKNYVPNKDCAHPLEHINIYNKKCLLNIAEKLNLKKHNTYLLKELNIKQRLSFLKNEFLFTTILLKK